MTSRLREWCRRLLGTFNYRDRETDEELRFHLQMAEEDALRRGQSVREARLRAGVSLRQPNPCATRASSAGSWISCETAGTAFASSQRTQCSPWPPLCLWPWGSVRIPRSSA